MAGILKPSFDSSEPYAYFRGVSAFLSRRFGDSKNKFLSSNSIPMFPKTLVLLVILSFSCAPTVVAQTPPKQPQPQQGMGGVSTDTPLNYATRRTVGITDPKAPVIFEDVTDKTAMANFKHRSGSTAKNYIFEVPSGGVAIFDYDG